jgi:glycosidase
VADQVTDPGSLFHTIRKMIAARKGHAAFGGSRLEWVESGNSAVASYTRRDGEDFVLVLSNLSREVQLVVVPQQFRKRCRNLLSSSIVALAAELTLQPYSYLWLQPLEEG